MERDFTTGWDLIKEVKYKTKSFKGKMWSITKMDSSKGFPITKTEYLPENTIHMTARVNLFSVSLQTRDNTAANMRFCASGADGRAIGSCTIFSKGHRATDLQRVQ